MVLRKARGFKQMYQSDCFQTLPPRTLYFIFVIDASGSMQGECIDTINETLEHIVNDLREIQKPKYVEIRVAIMKFGSTAVWLTDGAERVDEIVLNPIEAFGVTATGDALKKLEKAMSRRVLFKHSPYRLFILFGNPTDNWEEPLEKLQQNPWYKNSIKIGITYGKIIEKEVLQEIVGDTNLIIETQNVSDLSRTLYSLPMKYLISSTIPDDAPATEEKCAVPTPSSVKHLQEDLDLDYWGEW